MQFRHLFLIDKEPGGFSCGSQHCPSVRIELFPQLVIHPLASKQADEAPLPRRLKSRTLCQVPCTLAVLPSDTISLH